MGFLEEIDDGQLSTSSRLLRRIMPRYDYRSHERLKETDEKLRKKLLRDLTQTIHRLEGLHDRLYDEDRRAEANRVTGLRDRLETMRRRVRTARSGGGATRDLVVEVESDLLALVEYDATLIEASEELAAHAAEPNLGEGEGTLTDWFAECNEAIDEFERAWQNRRDRLDGLK
jgi:hypothetical protein